VRAFEFQNGRRSAIIKITGTMALKVLPNIACIQRYVQFA
jgi:hypothetical protein